MDIKNSQRIVIKIGSALLVDGDGVRLRKKWMESLIKDVVDLKNQGKEIVLVSSGSVALGKSCISSFGKHLKLEEKQAAAACGQIRLLKSYQEYLTKYKIYAAQILLTIQDTEDRRRYLNAKNTIETLFKSNVIPIINENDSVATSELRFGDNDRLAARVAQMIGADILVLLSDVDGLYEQDPRIDPNAKHIKEIAEITEEIENMAGVSISGHGSGGMMTKVEAAKIAVGAGCHTVITKGKENFPISSLINGSRCTWFVSAENPASARKHWIASSLHVKGKIIIDKGAIEALKSGTSLLPVGVVDVKGRFERGDAVEVLDYKMNKIGVGLVAYNSDYAKLIKGQKSDQIENLVGFSGRDELIHRDDFTILV